MRAGHAVVTVEAVVIRLEKRESAPFVKLDWMNNFEYKSATTTAGIFLTPFHSWTLAGSSGDDL